MFYVTFRWVDKASYEFLARGWTHIILRITFRGLDKATDKR